MFAWNLSYWLLFSQLLLYLNETKHGDIWRCAKDQMKHNQGWIQRGVMGAIAFPRTYESNFIHHDFVQFGKQHSRYKAILSSIVLSQQCCEVYFISLTVVNPWWDLAAKYYWNRSPPKRTGWARSLAQVTLSMLQVRWGGLLAFRTGNHQGL